jgi:hypothetical protein
MGGKAAMIAAEVLAVRMIWCVDHADRFARTSELIDM